MRAYKPFISDADCNIGLCERPDGFGTRMTENLAAMIVLGLLIGAATTGFNKIEHSRHCASAWNCRQ
jgi:hypothetical protein